MTFSNNSVPPTITEIAAIANVLDSMEAYSEAELLDEYIKQATLTNGDIIKMAGLWSDIWKRLKGRTKRLFIKEFREAHDAAKALQETLDKKIDVVNEKYTQISKALKTYQIADWYQGLVNFQEIGGDKLLADSGFQETYGRFMRAILGVKETTEEAKKEESEVSKVFGPTPGVEEKSEEDTENVEVGEWSPVVRRQPAVEEHFEGDKIRVQLAWWNKWVKKHLKRVPNSQGKIIFKVMPTIRDEKGDVSQQTPVNLEKGMGESMWETDHIDGNYIYLNKVKPEQIKETPTKKYVLPNEEFDEEPSLPKTDIEELGASTAPSLEPEKEPVKEEGKKEKGKKEEVKKEEVKKEEGGKEPAKQQWDPVEKGKSKDLTLESLKDFTWIRYNDHARKDLRGKYGLVRKVRPKVHDIVSDEKLIDYLSNLWLKQQGRTQPIKLESNKISGIKLSQRRFERVNRILELENN